jgi:hypothetical protein
MTSNNKIGGGGDINEQHTGETQLQIFKTQTIPV